MALQLEDMADQGLPDKRQEDSNLHPEDLVDHHLAQEEQEEEEILGLLEAADRPVCLHRRSLIQCLDQAIRIKCGQRTRI